MEHTVLRYEKEVKYMNNENKTNINCEKPIYININSNH